MTKFKQRKLGLRILVTANMGPGTLRAKVLPLSQMPEVEEILILRKQESEPIDKVKYLPLPSLVRISILHLVLHPIYLAYYARKHKVDLIVGYHFVPYAFFAHLGSLFSGVPFIAAQTGLLIQNSERNSLKGRWLNQIFKKTSYLFVPGEQSKSFWLKWGVPEKKIKLLHSTIDTSAFNRKPDQEEADFVFVGRLNPIKQIDLIIKGFHNVAKGNTKLRLLIVGDGPSKGELSALVQGLGMANQITFTGFQPNVKEYLDKAPFFVMSSKSEGLPCAIMEAMSNGNIVLSTLVGNIPDLIVEKKTGIPIHIASEEGIANAMLMALAMNGSERDEMVRNGRSLIDGHHSFKSAQEKWLEIFIKLNLWNA